MKKDQTLLVSGLFWVVIDVLPFSQLHLPLFFYNEQIVYPSDAPLSNFLNIDCLNMLSAVTFWSLQIGLGKDS